MNTKMILITLRLFLIMSVVTGVLYPVLIYAGGYFLFPQKANGSIVKDGSKLIGSLLIGQNPPDSGYFQPRPSAGNYSTVASSASNLAVSNSILNDTLKNRAANWGATVGGMPPDLIFSSGSGLDPHISPEAALLQIERIARIRGLASDKVVELRQLVTQNTEKPQFGILGEMRVNVLLLNRYIDKITASVK